MSCARAIMALLAVAAAASAQPAGPAPSAAPKETLASLHPNLQGLVRQRAQHFYRMPDGTVWDGWTEAEYRRLLVRSLKPLGKVEPPPPNPGQAIVEDRVTGTAWLIKTSPEAQAWDLAARLGDERAELREQGLEKADPRTWTDAPPLWTNREQREYTWDFALVDESEADEYTRKVHGGYLETTRVWGDDRYEVKGYTLDRGAVDGIVTVPDRARWVTRDRFKGEFFLWPEGASDLGGVSRPAWRLIPPEQLRMTPDDLADALIAGKAELVTWSFERIKDKYLWKRSVREVLLAPTPRPKAEPKPPGPPNTGGPDLVILNDGRWYRGKIIKRDDHTLVIRTPVGQGDAELTLKMEEIREVQQPEKR
jgi:hypothetical protein